MTEHEATGDSDPSARCQIIRDTFAYNVCECPNTQTAFEVVCAAMPEEDFATAVQTPFLLAVCGGGASWAARLHCDGDMRMLVFRPELEDLSWPEAVGEVAHELAHLALGHDHIEAFRPTDEFEACAKAAQWGFGPEILDLVATVTQNEDPPYGWDDCVSRADELAALVRELGEHE